MRGFDSVCVSTALDVSWVVEQVPYECPYALDGQGRYVLSELIAIGPRSWVYAARDARMSSDAYESRVVVKISRNAGGREAEIGRQIEHPDVPAVLDRGITPIGHPYIVMAWIEGEGLDAVKVPWERSRAIRFVVRLGRIVERAHARGIVHCDLKPDNVRLAEGDRPVLMDFDLAVDRADHVTTTRRGNLGFMSPEQYRGEIDALSPQADVYALGGLAVYLLTGTPANGPDVAKASENLASARAWRAQAGDASLTRILMRALAPVREDRYPSVSELLSDLERWLAREPIAWQKPSAVQRAALWYRRRPALASGLIAGAAVLAAALAYGFQSQRAQSARAQELARIEIEAQRQAIERAEIEMNRLREMGRAQLLAIANTVLSRKADGQGEPYIPILYWLNDLRDLSVVFADRRPALLPERIDAMRRVLATNVKNGRDNTFPQMVTRIGLAHLLLRDARPSEALFELDTVRAEWFARLGPGDPIRSIVRALDIVARVRLDEEVPLTEVDAMLRELREVDAPQSYERLLVEARASIAR